ncbi:hypothetical protein A5788_09735 [Gordonia sp. 852002-50816_SCH5313054-c]|nr:hypothetical protein A5785_12190 [Gordonia sp. 852002-50395_SCH5434458]OBC14860.1 hypothetical protein A5786_22460 [Gordonia sp. 852002-50816_SCH5313054-a]OBC18397.1 hypothetical protein A5788_09735 [Gordonia sp. 852002-50816_SCH5313054-c]
MLITNLVRLAEFAPDLPDQVAEFRGSYVLAPLAYAHDEPIEEILEAARATPNIVWVLTGKAPKGLMDTSPPNIIYPGYVSRDHYQALVANSALIVGLTTKESTMQSAGFEAIAAGKPFVTSDTRVLREYFENAAVYTSIDADEIAGNVTAVLQNIDDWTKRMAARREDRIAIQRIQVENARQWIGKLASTSK